MLLSPVFDWPWSDGTSGDVTLHHPSPNTLLEGPVCRLCPLCATITGQEPGPTKQLGPSPCGTSTSLIKGRGELIPVDWEELEEVRAPRVGSCTVDGGVQEVGIRLDGLHEDCPGHQDYYPLQER